jgi:hypothetical protein
MHRFNEDGLCDKGNCWISLKFLPLGNAVHPGLHGGDQATPADRRLWQTSDGCRRSSAETRSGRG